MLTWSQLTGKPNVLCKYRRSGDISDPSCMIGILCFRIKWMEKGPPSIHSSNLGTFLSSHTSSTSFLVQNGGKCSTEMSALGKNLLVTGVTSRIHQDTEGF